MNANGATLGGIFVLTISLASMLPAAELKNLPASLTVRQRSTLVVPGSDGKLQITLDDITRGQVITSVSHAKQGVLVGPTSLRPGDAKSFDLGGKPYRLRLTRLSNALLGEDHAEFELDLQPDLKAEAKRLDKLLTRIESLERVVFFREGKELTPKQESTHLRELWKTHNAAAGTVEKFIDDYSRLPPTGGIPYLVRTYDDSLTTGEEFLHDQLQATERKQE